METRKLQHLLELSTTRSFSRAASNLHLTQSALSKSIQALEDEMGAQLVDRRGRQCLLTPTGELVVDRARRLLAEIDDLLQTASKGEPEGTLRIGFGAGPGAAMCSDFIKYITKNYPRMRLVIRRGTAQSLLRELNERTIDLLMIDARTVPVSTDLTVEILGNLIGGAVCRNDHPLLADPQVTVEKFCKYPILSTSVTDEIARFAIEIFGPLGDPRLYTTVESEELEPLVKAALESDSLFFGVIAAAQEFILAGKAKVLVLSPPINVKIPVSLVRISSRAETRFLPIVKTFVSEWIAESQFACQKSDNLTTG